MAGNNETLKTYHSALLWFVGIIFIAGGLYYQVDSNTKANEKAALERSELSTRVALTELSVNNLTFQMQYQKEWQGEFMTTFKDLVKEIRTMNNQVLENTSDINHYTGRRLPPPQS